MTKLNLFLSTLFTLQLKCVFSQWSPPVWEQSSISLSKPEDLPEGALITTIKATSQNGVPVTLEVYDATSQERIDFNYTRDLDANSATGYIYRKKELDRDQDISTWDLYFKAYDQHIDKDQVPLYTVSLSITDVNDNPPKFEHSFYTADVDENAQVNAGVVITVSASDPDNGAGGSFTYKLVPVGQSAGSIAGTFSIRTNGRIGEITLQKKLDYEKLSLYEYLIIATDMDLHKPLSGNVSLVIKVRDVQDSPPYFDGLPYIAKIDENVPVGTAVTLNITALDRDTGVPNAIEYRFKDEGPCDALFGIDTTTGKVTTKGSTLDRDSSPVSDSDVNGVCRLNVEAYEVNSTRLPQYGANTTDTTVVITIKDINDNSPIFNSTVYNANVTENTSSIPLEIDGEIFVSDKDQEIAYNQFDLELKHLNGSSVAGLDVVPSSIAGSGNVILRLKSDFRYDYEKEHTVDYILVAKEKSKASLSGSCTIRVNIQDMNDNIPIFSQTSYDVSARENSIHESFSEKALINITATDQDSGIFGTITFKFLSADSHFQLNKINSTTVELRTKEVTGNPLDRETRDNYFLILEASDGGGGRSTVTLNITLTDVNDNAPQFVPGYRRFSVEENKDSFESDIVINATDNDLKSTNNSVVKYRLEPPPFLKNNFTIDPNSGNITLKHALDYEELKENDAGVVLLTVIAYDLGEPSLNSTVYITISVQDENDNAPNFYQNSYNFSVPENSNHGKSVGTVNATDLDGTPTNSRLTYYIETGGMDKFRINSETGTITVDLNANIDRESIPVFNLTVLAIDRGTPALNGTAMVTINVQDVNDKDPEFTKTVYTEKINESVAPHTLVAHCTAHDDDLNSDLQYNITQIVPTYSKYALQNESFEDYFNISKEGEVYLLKPIDREVVTGLTLALLATDLNGIQEQTATASLSISILDTNDNPPVFTSLSTTKIQEGTINGIVMTITATDRDEDTKFNFKISSNPLNAFELTKQPQTEKEGIIQIDRLAVEIDRETKDSLQMTLCADDTKFTTCENFTFIVTDVNDNSPTFSQNEINVNLSENFNLDEYNRTFVLNISATDKDVGMNGNISYKIVSGKDLNYFELTDGGDIYVNGNIDRERSSRYTLIIEATDNPLSPEKPLTGTATIIIDVTDVNDNAPKFTSPFPSSILETADIGTSVLTLIATDKDGDEYNKFYYEFTVNQTLFALNQETGVISVKNSLRRHYGTHNVTVLVIDNNNNNLTDETVVTITVKDINDNAPVFSSSDPTKFKVYECAKIRTEITIMNASDEDAPGPNSDLEFSIDNANYATNVTIFDINNSTGEIKTLALLDANVQDIYLLTIMAKDHGDFRLSATTTIQVDVIDVNDHPPEFLNPHTTASVEENTVGIRVMTVTATDKDKNSEIRYSIIEINDQYYSNHFEIKDQSGEIWILKEIDREQTSSVNITVRATDITGRNISKDCDDSIHTFDNKTEITLFVQIKDQNDNPPIFKDSSINTGIRRNVKLNTIVSDLKIWVEPDPDIGNNRIHTFQYNGHFSYDSKGLEQAIEGTNKGQIQECPEQQKKFPICLTPNGTLLTNMLFEENMKGYMIILIQVFDAAGNSTTELRLDIIADDQTLAMLLYQGKSFVQFHETDILGNLSAITGFKFVGDGIESYVENGISDGYRTYLYFHVIDKDKQVMDAVKAKDIFDQNWNKLSALAKKYAISSVKEYKDTLAQEDSTGIKTTYIMIGIISLLSVAVLTVGFCYCNSITKYQRKLKAATTSTSKDSIEKEQHPNTNEYATSTNPLYDTLINPIQYDHYTDIDNLSVASVDSNQFKKKTPLRGTEEKGAVMDIYEDEVANQEDVDALAQVLERVRKQKEQTPDETVLPPMTNGHVSDDFKHTFDNEAFELNLETTEV